MVCVWLLLGCVLACVCVVCLVGVCVVFGDVGLCLCGVVCVCVLCVVLCVWF